MANRPRRAFLAVQQNTPKTEEPQSPFDEAKAGFVPPLACKLEALRGRTPGTGPAAPWQARKNNANVINICARGQQIHKQIQGFSYARNRLQAFLAVRQETDG